MSAPQQKRRNQERIGRLEIVAKYYKQGFSIRKICEKVKTELGKATCAKATVEEDIKYLLAEWRKDRITDDEEILQLELERIDYACSELWPVWEETKDPRYITEIRQQLAERRKLLGMYAPEKKDISGEMNFASFLLESGVLDQAEKEVELTTKMLDKGEA